MLIALKVVLTPTVIAGATLLARRFGHSFSGWLVGFPFTSAPVSLFLALEQGRTFASAAAVGSVYGVLAQTSFPLAYAYASAFGWPHALVAGTLAFAVVGIALGHVHLPLAAVVALDVIALALALRLMPARKSSRRAAGLAARWDLPSRMIVATILVVGLTEIAPLLGAFTSGLVSGYPVYASVLAIFAQRALGPSGASEVMRGLIAGLFGFAAFFLVIALTLAPWGIVPAYTSATVAVLAVQGMSLALLRRSAARTGS
jgi:hypothetical protein